MKISEKLATVAIGGAFSVALLAAEWACCYFDVPYLSYGLNSNFTMPLINSFATTATV